MKKRLSRRALLRGAGGVAVALPFLEIMEPSRAAAQVGAQRFLVALQGVAQTRRNAPTDPGFAALAPLRSDVMFVTNTTIASSPTPGPGGMPSGPFHPKIISPLLTGWRSTSDNHGPQGSTADQIVATAFAGMTAFDSLAYRVQAQVYVGGTGAMSARGTGGGPARTITPIASPRLAWEQLFSGFTPGSTPPPTGGPSPMQRMLDDDRSVLDLVRERASRLLGIVGSADRIRLEQHFEEIRALEGRLAAVPMPPPPGMTPMPGGSTCMGVVDPGADPPSAGYAWSDETRRGELFVELVAQAFACDLTRSVSLMLSVLQSQMSSREMTGNDIDIHEVTHTNDTRQATWLENVTDWHVRLFARLVERLKSLPEGSGTVLDNTVCVLLFEGVGAHSHTNVTSVVAGRPSVLRMGSNVSAGGAHPCQLLSTAMHSIGVDHDMGEVPGMIPAALR